MKRFAVIITGISLVTILAACGAEPRSNPAGEPPSQSPAVLTEEDAKNIALTDAGVTEADVTGIRIKLDTDRGVQEYEVEFYAGNLEYDYAIEAATGQIRSRDTDIEDDFPRSSPAA